MLNIKKRVENFSWIFAAILLMSCANTDRSYVHEGVQKFLDETTKEGMTFTEVQQSYRKLSRDLELFNNCSEAFEVSATPCDQGYTSMIVFPASVVMMLNRSSDNGDVQVSLTFDKFLVLKNQFYEIYFEDEHV